MKKIVWIIVLICSIMCNQLYCQENIEVKTNELYMVDLPSSGEFYHKTKFVLWEIDLKNKKIFYQDDDEKRVFTYIADELVTNNGAEITIKFENKNEAIYFSSYENYIKISFFTNMDPMSSPRSYKRMKSFSNFEMNNLFEIMNVDIN